MTSWLRGMLVVRIVQGREVEALLDALKHEDRGTQACAAQALGNIGGERALEALRRIVSNEGAGGWDMALLALAKHRVGAPLPDVFVPGPGRATFISPPTIQPLPSGASVARARSNWSACCRP